MAGRRHAAWVEALALGTAFGLIVAAIATWRDWRGNPGGIFHGADGTDWSVVAETGWTWFWPVALLAAALAALAFHLLRLRRRRRP